MSDVRSGCGMDTQRLFSQSTGATRRAIAICAATTQSRDLNCCGLTTNAKILTDNSCFECNERERVQEEACGLCGVGIFTLRFGVRLWWIIRSTPTDFILSIATICPTTNSSKEDRCVFCFALVHIV